MTRESRSADRISPEENRSDGLAAEHRPPAEGSWLETFEPVDHAAWRRQVETELRGADFRRALVHTTADGLDIEALHGEGTAPTAGDPAGLPGVAPFTRGTSPLGDTGGQDSAWKVGTRVDNPDPEAAHGALLADLRLGANLVWLGSRLPSASHLDTLLEGVEPGFVEVVLGSGYGSRAHRYLDWVSRRGIEPRELSGCLGIDPLGALARRGSSPRGLDATWEQAAELARRCGAESPRLRAVLVSALPFHDAGATPALELALGLASGVETLRRLTASGLDPVAAADQVLAAHGVGTEMFLEMAKLRAWRLLWSKVLKASGAADAAARQRLVVVGSDVGATRVDPWVNMLRSSAQVFAGAVAGADGIVVGPWDRTLGAGQPAARRQAVNTHHVLAEESYLTRVADPAGGSWAIEAMTDQLARKAWGIFREIEAGGGLQGALLNGDVARRIAEVVAHRSRDLAKRKRAVVGVSMFANLDEERPEADAPSSPSGDDGGEPAVRIEPLAPFRAASGFEALRLSVDRRSVNGDRPAVFLANLGSPRDHRVRAGFAGDALAAAGLATVDLGGFEDDGAVAKAFADSGAVAAILCSTDEVYAERVPSAAAALRRAGCRYLLVAGRPGDHGEAWTRAGVDDFLYLGCDVQRLLKALLEDLLGKKGVAP
ncbi:MAG: methylmalonyl-CoA mutase family protein [Acidobacteriota bacterium]